MRMLRQHRNIQSGESPASCSGKQNRQAGSAGHPQQKHHADAAENGLQGLNISRLAAPQRRQLGLNNQTLKTDNEQPAAVRNKINEWL